MLRLWQRKNKTMDLTLFGTFGDAMVALVTFYVMLKYEKSCQHHFFFKFSCTCNNLTIGKTLFLETIPIDETRKSRPFPNE